MSIAKRYVACLYSLLFVGVVYRYGNDEYRGDDPIKGMDCSGFLSEIMRAVGVLENWERLAAQGFYDRFADAEVFSPRAGVLRFYGNDTDKITHISMCLSKHFIIEAGGGSRDTKDDDTAAKRNAFVRIRPITHREGEVVGMVDPFVK